METFRLTLFSVLLTRAWSFVFSMKKKQFIREELLATMLQHIHNEHPFKVYCVPRQIHSTLARNAFRRSCYCFYSISYLQLSGDIPLIYLNPRRKEQHHMIAHYWDTPFRGALCTLVRYTTWTTGTASCQDVRGQLTILCWVSDSPAALSRYISQEHCSR